MTWLDRTRRLLLCIVMLAPAGLEAQEAVYVWPGLARPGNARVYVLDDRGIEIAGRLVRIGPDDLVLLAGGAERPLDAARIVRIDRRGDSLKNGFLTGALVGLAMGVLAAGISDCPGESPGGPCPGVRATAVAVSTGLYAAIGTGIDALIVGRTRLYEAPAVHALDPPPHVLRRTPPQLRLRLRW